MAKMNFLFIGGAGYIGSNVVDLFIKKPWANRFVVYDNLATGSLRSLAKDVLFVQGDCRNEELLVKTLADYAIDVVFHFGASTFVGESTREPISYYDNNFGGTLTILKAMRRAHVNKIIFSSSAAVYGNQASSSLSEDMPVNPINAYGASKLACEQLLMFCSSSYKMNYVALRYFNVAGAGGESNQLGIYNPKTQLLIPKINDAILHDQPLNIFGRQQNHTNDGTCVRDYVHVADVASAHVCALEWMMSENQSGVFNVASGTGTSVLECVRIAERCLQHEVKLIFGSKRPGDPQTLIANVNKIKKVLKWKSLRSVEDMIISDYNFRKNFLTKGVN